MSGIPFVGLRTIPMLLAMGTIFTLSAQPGDTLYLPPLPSIDKLAHAVVYGVLAATTIFAFTAQYKEKKPRAVLAVTSVFCCCFGISDEFHQYFVPGRMPSGFDVLADTCGALAICLYWAGARKHRRW